jgi:GNAT superfamily N-acetyltransferase
LEEETEIQIEDIRESNLRDVPEPCRGCVYWEFPEAFETGEKDPAGRLQLEAKKKEWFTQTMKEFGTCGKVVYQEGVPVAFAQYAPSMRLPGIKTYESKPVGKLEEGVVFLSCLFIRDEPMRRKGVGKLLLQNIVEDLRRRGFKAIETFACRSGTDNPSGPMMFYVKNGFHVKDNSDPEFPLVRIFLQSFVP